MKHDRAVPVEAASQVAKISHDLALLLMKQVRVFSIRQQQLHAAGESAQPGRGQDRQASAEARSARERIGHDQRANCALIGQTS
jgi:hypothetical protein